MTRIITLFLMIFLTGCITETTEVGEIEGLKPVYVAEEDNVVEVQQARGFENLGKIVYAEPYLFINELFQGIHVLDNSDPADPIKIAFIQIPGNTDFTLKAQFLYANHGRDLKTFSLGQESANLGAGVINIQETGINASVFSNKDGDQVSALFPPSYNGFFECVDTEKGIVVAWEPVTLINPECRI